MIVLVALLALQETLPDGGEIRRRAERILASPEYSTEGASASDTGILESILRWLQKRLGELMSLGQDKPYIFWLVLISCLVVLGAIFLHAGIVLSRALRESRAGAGEPVLAGPGGGRVLRRTLEDVVRIRSGDGSSAEEEDRDEKQREAPGDHEVVAADAAEGRLHRVAPRTSRLASVRQLSTSPGATGALPNQAGS